MELPKWCDSQAEQIDVTTHADKTRIYIRGVIEIRDNVFKGISYIYLSDDKWSWSYTDSNNNSLIVYQLDSKARDTIEEARITALGYLSKNYPDQYPHAIMIKTAMEITLEEA